MNTVAKKIKINGIVQGVGFRPFVCKIAKEFNIKGWVLNDTSGVTVHIEGDNMNISNFVDKVKNDPPPLSIINYFEVEDIECEHFDSFTIHESEKSNDTNVFISPDVCICQDCIKEILNKNNHRYYYPFTNCTNCGPRFSIIEEVPYDRKFTTMNPFIQCNSCKDEYTDIDNRRFHAQPNCCPKCGPSISISNGYGVDITGDITKGLEYNSSVYNKALIDFFKGSISSGKIWAIKGVTGYHLACIPTDEKVVKLLRDRKNRPAKPLALMARDIKTIKKYCYVSEAEEKLLLSKARPIVLLNKKDNDNFPGNIAPKNKLLGFMLPSTPLDILIFENAPYDSLVMTSGNLSGLPLEYKNKSAIKNLATFVDFFLNNDREIVLPLDDSIVKCELDDIYVTRRGRGYVPIPLFMKESGEILALGSDMKNTFSISKEDYVYMGPHNGDLDNYEVIERLKENIDRYMKLFHINPKLIACDKHPRFVTKDVAKEYKVPIKTIQHHHAHIVSCMIDNNYSEDVIGIAFDGTGYGDDNCIWGSEFMICNYSQYTRVGHLKYVNVVGGDDSLRDGDKMALSYLHEIEDSDIKADVINKYYKGNYEIIFKMLKYSSFSYLSSSMGRLFDAVSSIIGLCHHSRFEGEASIALESIIESDELTEGYPINIECDDNMYIMSPIDIIKFVLEDISKGMLPSIISQKFHSTIVNYIVKMCILLRDKYKINTVALSGGIFQNSFLLRNSYMKLSQNNFKVLTHHNIPCNDGGISIGQIVIANND